jgi:hypothetical protein
MAYSAANLATAETTGFNADKPMMVSQSLVSPTVARWNDAGTTTDAATTAADGPAVRAYDNIGSLQTKDTSADLATRYLVFDIGSSSTISFDTCLILNHNLNSGANPFATISLEISDVADFGTSGGDNTIEIFKYTVSGTSDDRLLCTNLNSAGGSSTYDANGTAQRYSGVRFVRIKITALSGTARQAKIGEVWLGTRYQLQRNPDVPWNNKDEFSQVTEFKALSGLTRRYVHYRGQALRNFRASISASAEITVIENWFNGINEGTSPFLYIEKPSSGAEPYLMILNTPALNFQLVGPFERILSFSMTEQPPYLSRE